MAQKEIELILLRQCASHMAMPIWVMDLNGDLLYFNEAAEPILGQSFDEADPIKAEELSEKFFTTDEDGLPLESSELPINIALTKRKPAHRPMRIQGLDGILRMIEVTAFPIMGHGGEHLGAIAIFWESESE